MAFMDKRILFHGTTESYLKERFRQLWDLPANWTSCPLDALNHSHNSSRRHNSKLAVISLSDYPDHHFYKEAAGGGHCTDVDWYTLRMPIDSVQVERSIGVYCLDAREIKGRAVKDLATFVKEHFDEKHDHLDSLKAMNYRNLIFPGKPIPVPNSYYLREKPKRA